MLCTSPSLRVYFEPYARDTMQKILENRSVPWIFHLCLTIFMVCLAIFVMVLVPFPFSLSLSLSLSLSSNTNDCWRKASPDFSRPLSI